MGILWAYLRETLPRLVAMALQTEAIANLIVDFLQNSLKPIGVFKGG
ncbi:hypothetical protein NG796_24510 [Laspinema sp. A4]|nr:hypothetical protein [Laspinema sp. D2d]MCT7986438.1 hypothetical protein [Laspinema sp. D2d]